MTDISKIPYVLVEQRLRNEANELAQRAQNYITQKKLDRAIGCLNKAVNKINKANLLKMSPLEEAMFGPLLNKLSMNISKQIIEGK